MTKQVKYDQTIVCIIAREYFNYFLSSTIIEETLKQVDINELNHRTEEFI